MYVCACFGWMSVLTSYKHSNIKKDGTMSHVTTMANCATWLAICKLQVMSTTYRITDDTTTTIFMVQNESLVNGFTPDKLGLQTCILIYFFCVCCCKFVQIIFSIHTSWADFQPEDHLQTCILFNTVYIQYICICACPYLLKNRGLIRSQMHLKNCI